jgi:formimidoylglutamate deiminase
MRRSLGDETLVRPIGFVQWLHLLLCALPLCREVVVSRVHFKMALLGAGWQPDVLVTISGRTIAEITAGVPAPADAMSVGGVAMPGMPNVHCHAFQRAMAGLTERHGPADDSFWTWRETMYRFLAQMSPDDIETIAAMAYVEMLEAGFTRVGEFHYLHNAPDGSRYADVAETAGRIVAAAADAGIGLTLLPSFYAHAGCGGRPVGPGQERFLSDLDGFAKLIDASRVHLRRVDGANLGIAPHSLRAVDGIELEALALAFPNKPIHIHAAEQEKEVEECLAWSGARPVQWLLDNMSIDARWCLVHATHMEPEEINGLARSGAAAGLCPVTESNLGDGIFPAVGFQDAGGRIAIGTDSNVRIAVNEELRTLEYSQRLSHRRRNLIGGPGASTGRALFDATRRGGMQALGQCADGAPAPGLKKGQVADIVVLDDSHPTLVGRTEDQAIDAWIFAAGAVVRDVFAGGRHIVTEGRHVHAEKLRRRFANTMTRLLGQA